VKCYDVRPTLLWEVTRFKKCYSTPERKAN